jgi:hypothetical protein
MIPISKAEADRRLAAQEDDARERVEATRVWRENGGHGKPPSLQQEDSERASLVADGLVPPEADENPEAGTSGADAPVDPLAELDMAELVALANDKKVPVGEDATEESLRAELKALMSADAEEEQPPAPGAND